MEEGCLPSSAIRRRDCPFRLWGKVRMGAKILAHRPLNRTGFCGHFGFSPRHSCESRNPEPSIPPSQTHRNNFHCHSERSEESKILAHPQSSLTKQTYPPHPSPSAVSIFSPFVVSLSNHPQHPTPQPQPSNSQTPTTPPILNSQFLILN